jgi:gluconokinase
MYGCAESMKVENLRSPYVKTGGLYYFARMIDKIRLNAANLLPGDYQQVLGLGFDGRTCRFLRVDYNEFAERVLQGGTDEELLQWCFTRGRTPTDEEISTWNDWVRKKGWRDGTSARLKERLKESGFEDRTDIETMFDYLDLDEGRDPRHRNRDYNGEYE